METPAARPSPPPPRPAGSAQPPELSGLGVAPTWWGNLSVPAPGPPGYLPPFFLALQLAEKAPWVGPSLGFPAVGGAGCHRWRGPAARPAWRPLWALRPGAHRAAGARTGPRPTSRPKWLFAALPGVRPSPSPTCPTEPGARRAGPSPPGPGSSAVARPTDGGSGRGTRAASWGDPSPRADRALSEAGGCGLAATPGPGRVAPAPNPARSARAATRPSAGT